MRPVILTTLTLFALSQHPQVDCVSAQGQTRCSRTPWGKCIATNGRVFCGDPSYEALNVGLDVPRVSCLAANGTAACGYDCKSANGEVACAKTPWGRCLARQGHVTCADPKLVAWGVEPEPIECASAYGEVACGYDCKAAYGQLACAQTQWGKCLAAAGRVTCGDPSRMAFRGGRVPEQVQCTTAYGQTACGYDCKAAYGQLQCASAPWGRCVAAYGQVTCSP